MLKDELERPQSTGTAAWYAMAVMMGVAILSYTDRYILNVLIGGIRSDLGLTDVAISLAQGPAFAGIYAVMAIFLGRAADRVNRRNLILGGLLVWSIGTAGCGLATNLQDLLLARFIVGIGEAGLFPSAVSLLADAFPPHRRGLALGALLTGAAMGGGMAVIAGGSLLAWLPPLLDWPMLPGGEPWRGVLIILGSLGIPMALFVMLVAEPVRRRDQAVEGAQVSIRAIIKVRGPLLATILIAVALIAVVDAAATAWTPQYFIRTFAFSPAAIASTLGIVTLVAGVSGNLLGGALVDTLEKKGDVGMRLVVAAGGALIAVPALLYAFVPSSPALALFGLLTFLIGVVNVAACSAFLRSVPNEVQGIGTATLAFVLTLSGLATGPTVAALVTEYVFRSPDQVGSSIALIGVVVLLPAALLLWRAARIARQGG